jgi:hypothetical protein
VIGANSSEARRGGNKVKLRESRKKEYQVNLEIKFMALTKQGYGNNFLLN